jgi:hypothetical protein
VPGTDSNPYAPEGTPGFKACRREPVERPVSRFVEPSMSRRLPNEPPPKLRRFPVDFGAFGHWCPFDPGFPSDCSRKWSGPRPP